MKKLGMQILIAMLGLVGGVFGAALTRTLVPVANYLECHLRSCDDHWNVSRVLYGSHGRADTRWFSAWDIKKNLPLYKLDEHNPDSPDPNRIDLSFNPVKLNQEYDVATAKYGGSTCAYMGRVQVARDGLKYAWGDYVCDTGPNDGWKWTATIVTSP